MGIFDSLKDKASELLQTATEKVTDATGVDLGGVTDKVTEATGVDLGGVADQATESAEGLTESAQGYADTAGDQLAGTTGIDVPTEGVVDQATDQFKPGQN
ncbi:hypothetical protein [Streptomyces sp. SID13031]|uniref:hypothetical protein n=1 Tax=Streptomyces sp. SID13031 TaxID=2706046 RepID=UPI0013C97050|nr:hypothetical protein [Streptomyces sp. SID13031]NEA37312.1 hypothetical protein [Streptomyces sp. SID13031]